MDFQITIWGATGNTGLDTQLNYYAYNPDGTGLSFDINNGPKVYTGPESAPVFAVGTFDGFGSILANPSDTAGVLTFASAPEPATWAMMLAGFAGLGALGYRSRRALAA